jgi:hypothetical protein
MKRFLIYFFRWQISSLILAPCIYIFSDSIILAAICSNAIGASIFWWIDKWIFKERNK